MGTQDFFSSRERNMEPFGTICLQKMHSILMITMIEVSLSVYEAENWEEGVRNVSDYRYG